MKGQISLEEYLSSRDKSTGGGPVTVFANQYFAWCLEKGENDD